jgi:large subunit ribosomal protein L24
MKIKKGDTVVVITGKDKGKTGKVLEVFPKEDRVLVDGVNLVSRHQKPKSAQEKGGIIKKTAPIHASNVMIYEDGKATRVANKFIDGKKVRVSVKSGKSLDKEFVKAVKKQAKTEKVEKVEKPIKTVEKPEEKKTAVKTVKTADKPATKPAAKTADKPATKPATTKKVATKNEDGKVEAKKTTTAKKAATKSESK